MASSSISPTSRLLTYDVFLSFRGKDTRKTYVDHLYSTLELRGIYTFKDDKTLRRGETINQSLVKAIKESQIAIVVFSKNYADSPWCLRELEFIMECWNKGELIVMPIFYDVTPSDVRNQRGKFGEAFAKQESKNSSSTDSWKKTLEDAASIAGWEPKDMANGHQAEGIKQIVDIVSQRLKPLDSNAQENLIGIDTRMNDLISRLRIESGGVRMVGIWGIGGGGKTTLASSVYMKISCQFEGSCLVENIWREVSRYSLEKLQKKILSDVLKEKFKVSSVEEGRRILESRLRHRKNILIVLDDVDDICQLEALAGSHGWFGEGSRIIITTRDQHLLKAADVIYNITLLDNNEAILVFRRLALRKRRFIEDYEEISKLSQNVVYYARGLPLALRVLGLSLCDKDMSEWISALDRLREIPEADIVNKLKVSYDGLTPVQKELFLDIACFFRQWPKDKAIEILKACGLHPVIGIKELIQKALISISNGRFTMHDLIQEMGHYIVRGKHPDNPEKHSRVWQVEDIEDMCNWDETTDNVEIQALHAPHYYVPPNVHKVISRMKNLRSLYVRQNAEGLVKNPAIFLSRSLRWISWEHYPASSLPTNFQPRNLVSLILQNSLQKELWSGSKRLPNLEVLDISNSKNLIKTPDLGEVKNLKRLVLSGCSNLEYVHPSTGYHEKLTYLNLNGCDKLETFPPIVRMKKLETLLLSKCSHVRTLEITHTMDSLKHIDLDMSGIEVVPLSIGKYCPNLVSISLIGCNSLKSIECNFQQSKRRWWFSVGS